MVEQNSDFIGSLRRFQWGLYQQFGLCVFWTITEDFSNTGTKKRCW